MKSLGFAAAAALALLLSPAFSESAFACSCAGMPSPSATLARATVVFSGRAVSGDIQAVRFQVDKIWKGPLTSEITMLTGTKLYANSMVTSSCDTDYSLGADYVIYASGTVPELLAIACSGTGPVSEAALRGLDAVVPHKKIGNDLRPCTATSTVRTESASGEIRLLLANPERTALAAVSIVLEGPGGRHATLTDAAGKASFSGVAAGDYKITADAEGYAPRRITAQLQPRSCVAADVFLLPLPVESHPK